MDEERISYIGNRVVWGGQQPFGLGQRDRRQHVYIIGKTGTGKNPKYRFPGKREHNGTVHEFRKSAFVYNGNAIQAPVNDLVIVQGFAAAWWLWQHGLPNTVALMGSVCNEAQADIIVNLTAPNGRIWVFPDGDDAGEKCGKGCVLALSRRRFVSWAVLDDRRQPTECMEDELRLLLPITSDQT